MGFLPMDLLTSPRHASVEIFKKKPPDVPNSQGFHRLLDATFDGASSF